MARANRSRVSILCVLVVPQLAAVSQELVTDVHNCGESFELAVDIEPFAEPVSIIGCD
jgi:hypothetical protein